MRGRLALIVAGALLLAGCAAVPVQFANATPGRPLRLGGWLARPPGAGPFPAVLLLHGCHGVTASTHDWAQWFRAQGYVTLVVDSWGARGMAEGCSPSAPDLPSSARFDDAVGALRFLHTLPFVDRTRIGAIGWSNGGLFALALVNAPTHARQARRGVVVPEPGVRAAVGVYPGGCPSLRHERVVRPILVLIGDADDWTAPGPCVEMVAHMRRQGADATIVLYPGAVHYFANYAGTGFDALVAAKARAWRHLLRGAAPYVVGFFAVLRGYVPPCLELRLDDTAPRRVPRVTLLILANGPNYAGYLRIAPPARLDDGLLDLIVVRDVGRLELLLHLPLAVSGRHLHHPKVTALRARSVDVAAGTPLPVQSDGEVVGTLPARFDVLPGALRLLQA